MKVMFPPIMAICLAAILFSCAAEDMETQSEELKAANLEVYQTQDLEGRWGLVSMTSNVAVDFNDEDEIAHHDILVETNCFDDMFYEFKANGIVIANQKKLHFNSTGISLCEGGIYEAPYSLIDDKLTISFNYNGSLVEATKQIELKDNKTSLHIKLERLEASTYIKDDRGNSTSVIGSIEMVYKKK